jgi:hypothetical protein
LVLYGEHAEPGVLDFLLHFPPSVEMVLDPISSSRTCPRPGFSFEDVTGVNQAKLNFQGILARLPTWDREDATRRAVTGEAMPLYLCVTRVLLSVRADLDWSGIHIAEMENIKSNLIEILITTRNSISTAVTANPPCSTALHPRCWQLKAHAVAGARRDGQPERH